MTLRVTDAAASDLDRIKQYIAREDGVAAERLVDHTRRVLRLLRDWPKIGSEGIVSGTLEMPIPRTPYVVVYRVDISEPTDDVVILRVFHAAQDR
jgi:toxin ParE1/3/4